MWAQSTDNALLTVLNELISTTANWSRSKGTLRLRNLWRKSRVQSKRKSDTSTFSSTTLVFSAQPQEIDQRIRRSRNSSIIFGICNQCRTLLEFLRSMLLVYSMRRLLSLNFWTQAMRMGGDLKVFRVKSLLSQALADFEGRRCIEQLNFTCKTHLTYRDKNISSFAYQPSKAAVTHLGKMLASVLPEVSYPWDYLALV